MKLPAFGLLFLLCLSLFDIGSTLKCYECTWKNSEGCYSPINENSVYHSDCTQSHFIPGNHAGLEYKCVAFVDRYPNDKAKIFRQCVVKSDTSFCEQHRKFGQIQGYSVEECHECTDNYCNSSTSIRVGGIFKFLPLMFVIRQVWKACS